MVKHSFTSRLLENGHFSNFNIYLYIFWARVLIFGSVFPRFINILLTEINIEIIYLKKLCHDCSDAVVGRLSIILLLRPKSKIGSIEVPK